MALPLRPLSDFRPAPLEAHVSGPLPTPQAHHQEPQKFSGEEGETEAQSEWGCGQVPREQSRARAQAVRSAGQTSQSWTVDLLRSLFSEPGESLRGQGWGQGGTRARVLGVSEERAEQCRTARSWGGGHLAENGDQ